MEQIIERIKRGHYWKFHGGIHPPENKFLTNNKPIRNLALPSQLILPLQQHIGRAGKLLVQVGDKVLKGQALTYSQQPMSVPIHAPTSGTISAIKPATIAHPSGMEELCIFLTPDGEDQWQPRQVCNDFNSLSPAEIITKIANAGISGMGGAGFPTHIKVNTNQPIKFLFINAVECEPYITADDLLMREQSPSIINGIEILDKLLSPEFIFIGIEDNKPDAIKALQNATKHLDKVRVCVLPTMYPTGGEKQLIQILTGQEVPSGVLPSSLGIVMQNVATCYAIADAVLNDTPLIKRVVTVTGQALAKPQNIWALLGTPIEHLLNHCGYQASANKQIIMGGPMMGYTLPTTQVPVVKTTNCVLVPSDEEIPTTTKEVECIRCGQCADVCPSQLLPQELQWSAKAKDHQQLNKLNLFDCIECGACAYVCPSQIPLVHYYRISKAEIREQQVLDLKAEQAKKRFEARKIRLEKEKLAREAKHKKAAEARKARMNSGTDAANKEMSAVAAALARVKAKKLQGKASKTTTEQTEVAEPASEKSQVSAAIARAKAKKLAAQQAKQQSAVENSSDKVQEATAADDKKAKVAATIAKAKAKKLAAQQALQESSDDVSNNSSNNNSNNSVTNELTEQASTENEAQKVEKETEQVNTAADAKKAKIAATIAKAKAKKLAAKTKQETQTEIAVEEQVEEELSVNKDKSLKKVKPAEQTTPVATDKKAKIAAAVAKAKAKKLAQENAQQAQETQETADEPTKTADSENVADGKKKRIAAAVAKAKAKKLAQQQKESI